MIVLIFFFILYTLGGPKRRGGYFCDAEGTAMQHLKFSGNLKGVKLRKGGDTKI